MRDLNKAQLQNELTRRWGKNAHAELYRGAMLKPERDLIRTLMGGVPYVRRWKCWERAIVSYRCRVGYLSHIVFTAFCVEGCGDTWREALAEADRRKAAA